VGLGFLSIKVLRSHSVTPHSVRLLWTSDWHIAKTSIWQHTILTRDKSESFAIWANLLTNRITINNKTRCRNFGVFVVICIQTLIFFFPIEIELEAASSLKMSETFSTFAWYQNLSRKNVYVIKSNTKYFMLFIPCTLFHQYTDNINCFINILTIPNNLYILNDQFYVLEFSPSVKILLKVKWIHFVYLVLKYGEFTHITLIFCSNVGIMSGIFTGRRVSSFSQGSFKICKNSIFDLASCIPSWNTKFDTNTVVSRYLSCSDNAANASAATSNLDSCTQLHIMHRSSTG